ncbi:MAG TPA: AMP-binding protein, partial [Nocardioides sp.]|nr:AMP-binding protein [Nocardioides sp.]
MTHAALDNLLHEQRRFAPPADLAAHANVQAEAYDRAAADREAFWAEAAERLTWSKRWDRVLDADKAPFFTWFVGGELNASYNCVDRHVEAGNGDRVAIHWVGEPIEDRRDITYAQLKDEVSRAANALEELGIERGDRVAIYMPMIPEAVVAMLACARLGAVHTVVFGGFSSDALATRIDDCEAKLVITSDGGYRRGAASALKPAVDEALVKLDNANRGLVENVLVVRRTGQDVAWNGDVDIWWHDIVDNSSEIHVPQPMDAEQPLYVMYTSGTTAKPKLAVHTHGGYQVHIRSMSDWMFGMKDTDVWWATSDIGWVVGHSYIVYAPLLVGATTIAYEGALDHPNTETLYR